jgi:hypothetical protein
MPLITLMIHVIRVIRGFVKIKIRDVGEGLCGDYYCS